MMTYPDDGGLKEPVRPFTNTGFGTILRHFANDSNHGHGLSFETVHIPHLFYWASNKNEEAGHVRLFGNRAGEGWVVYSFNRQAPAAEWALHRRWNFGLFCVHHVEPEKKATDPAGWHITWAKLKFAKVAGGFSITWRLADKYSCKVGR